MYSYVHNKCPRTTDTDWRILHPCLGYEYCSPENKCKSYNDYRKRKIIFSWLTLIDFQNYELDMMSKQKTFLFHFYNTKWKKKMNTLYATHYQWAFKRQLCIQLKTSFKCHFSWFINTFDIYHSINKYNSHAMFNIKALILCFLLFFFNVLIKAICFLSSIQCGDQLSFIIII